MDLREFLAGPDDSGKALAAALRQSRNGSATRRGGSSTPQDFMQQGEETRRKLWDDIPGTLAAEGRNNGVMRLACSLRETSALDADQAIGHMTEHVWPLIDQGQGGHSFPYEEFCEVIRAVWRQYPGGAERAQQAAAATADLQANPLPHSSLELTDAYITDRAAAAALAGRYCWARGLGWLRWDGKRWAVSGDNEIWDELRKYFIWLHWATASAGADQALLARLTALLTAARVKAVASLCSGHKLVLRQPEEFDAHPDLLNTPDGVVNLRDGSVKPHDPLLLLTRITRGSCKPGFRHQDWEQALTALDEDERRWLQLRMGQAVTGHPPSDGIMPVLQGGGENGKSCLTSDGPVKALGDYGQMASPKLITSHRPGASEHSTEMADLRGQRLLIGEELSEGRSIDVTALKRIQDVSMIKARYVHKDNIQFSASHTLMITSNYIPVIAETDHGTWRRLALLRFRYTYKKPGEPLLTEFDRTGDPGLKKRIRDNESGQHDAIVTWCVEGAMAWYANGCADAPVTDKVREDTRQWRVSSDHIAGFWDEYLEGALAPLGEHPYCISASHLFTVFSMWLARNGHTAWSRELFFNRFGEHEESRNRGVEYRITKQLDNISWATDSHENEDAAQARVWVGVRFRKEGSPTLSRQGDVGDAPRTNLPMRESPETFVQTASPASPSPRVVTPSQFSAPPGISTESDQNAVVFDLETGPSDQLFTSPRGQFVRLAGTLGEDGDPCIRPVPELIAELDRADEISGHNIFGFDLLALAWHHDADWDRLAAKARDTELLERQANPPRGRESGSSADRYGLDAVAQRLGVAGKTDDLKRLARQHGGWDKIPLDDPEYRAYLEGDLRASAAVIRAMRIAYPPDPYLDREHVLAAMAGRMTLNGFAVNHELLDERFAEGEMLKRDCLQILHDGWGLPLTRTVTRGRGDAKAEHDEPLESPLSGTQGREWLEKFWEDSGLEDPPRTAKTGKLSISADDMKAVAARRPDLAEVCRLIGIVVSTRTVYQTARDCLATDGRVHARVSMRQSSGRWSVTDPGLTVFGKHGGRHHERDIFIPDPGHVLLSFDLSQVDMRAMAGHSQDAAYMALFEPGRDAHKEIAAQVGIDRQSAKAIGHGWNYGLGPKRMISSGLDEGKVWAFVRGMEERFPQLIAWREQIREQGRAGEILDNGFGRRMRCDPERAYTVAPALMGQGGARDIMCESLLHLPREIWPMLRVMVHDEILLSVPLDQVPDVVRTVRKAFTWTWRGVPILCDMTMGTTWGECSAK